MDIKDLICRGNAVFQSLVNGRDIATDGEKLDKLHSFFDISPNVIRIEYAKELDPTVLNDEVILFEVPEGYVAKNNGPTGQSYPVLSYANFDDNITTEALVTYWYTPETDRIETSLFSGSTIGNYEIMTLSLTPWLAGGSNVRAKVTTAGVGHTSKILITGVIYLHKM